MVVLSMGGQVGILVKAIYQFRRTNENVKGIMNRIAFVVAAGLSLAAGCAPHPAAEQNPVVGWVTRDVFLRPENRAFQERFDTVRVDTPLVGLIRNSWQSADVLVFFGTWCSDSRREVPHFLKIADAAGIPGSQVRLYALDRSIKSPEGLTDTYRIHRIPTIIFLRGGTEVGRITESPRSTLEGDMVAILAGSHS